MSQHPDGGECAHLNVEARIFGEVATRRSTSA